MMLVIFSGNYICIYSLRNFHSSVLIKFFIRLFASVFWLIKLLYIFPTLGPYYKYLLPFLELSFHLLDNVIWSTHTKQLWWSNLSSFSFYIIFFWIQILETTSWKYVASTYSMNSICFALKFKMWSILNN